MNRDEVDAFLADADDVIDDWEGSVDAASWSGDGSHETEIGGEYYGTDRPGPRHNPDTCPWCRLYAAGAPARLAEWEAELDARIRDLYRPAIRPPIERMAEALGIPLQPWQSQFVRAAGLQIDAILSATVVRPPDRFTIWDSSAAGVEIRDEAGEWVRVAATDIQLHGTEPAEEPETVVADDLVERPRRTSRTAQESPYGPGRRR